MKTLLSTIRHGLTFLAGIGGMLVTHSVIAPDQVDAINAAGSALIEPLTVIGGAVAAGVTRLAMVWVGKKFPALADKIAGVGPGGLPLLVMTCTAAGLMGFSLPSCSPAQVASFREIPMRIGIHGPDGTVSYSTASGLEVAAEVRAEK